MKVLDIMEPLTHWLTPEMTLHEAVTIMHQAKRGHGLSVNGIVVLDSERRLVGIVSTTDILRAIIPSHMFFDDDHNSMSWEALRQDGIAKTKNIHVGNVMTEDVRTIRTGESILRCADRLLSEQIRRLPVVAMDGKVVGVIYLRDVYNAVTELLCEPHAAAL
jgi:predicted transcriptional regulator